VIIESELTHNLYFGGIEIIFGLSKVIVRTPFVVLRIATWGAECFFFLGGTESKISLQVYLFVSYYHIQA